MIIWVVAPRTTDPCITMGLDSHVVFRPAAPGVGRLFVFLPGTGAVAWQYQLITSEAARAGYHALALTYPNDMSVSVLCAGKPSACYAATRTELLTGEDQSTEVAVRPVDGIGHRLTALLRFLQRQDPTGGWAQYLEGDSLVRWSRLSVAGHSQGGGHALFIAQRHAVWRVSAYASYGDYLPGGGEAAPWITQPYATPRDRFFGFISTRDEAISATLALGTWQSIGMAGDAHDIDRGAPPSGTQRFVTSADPANRSLTSTPYHNMVALDVSSPLDGSGRRGRFAPVWRAVSFP